MFYTSGQVSQEITSLFICVFCAKIHWYDVPRIYLSHMQYRILGL